MSTTTVPVGVDRSLVVSLRNQDDEAVTTYTEADIPYAEVWGGLDTPVILAPSCVWIDASKGTFCITLDKGDTQAIMPGRYMFRYGVKHQSGKTNAAPDQSITFVDSPGVTGSLSVYCTYQDMLDFDPGVEGQQTEEDLAGYVRQRHRARKWLDQIILNHASTGCRDSVFSTFFGSGSSNISTIRDQLEKNYLWVTEQVTEITAKYALYLVYNAKVGPSDKMTVWQNMANSWYAEVQRLVKGYRAEGYAPGNDVSPVFLIHCGRTSLR